MPELNTVGIIVVAAGAVVVLAVTSAVIQAINLIITSVDVHKGSKTNLGKELR